MRRGHVPMRTCRGCGRKRPQKELLRFVWKNGVLLKSGTAIGRAAYCCPIISCLERLQNNKKVLNQAFRLQN